MEALELLQWVNSSEVDNICISLSTGATNPQVRKRAISLIGTRQLEGVNRFCTTLPEPT